MTRLNWEKNGRRRRALAQPALTEQADRRYFLTHPSRPTECARCHREADEIALRPSDLHTLCLGCAERAGIEPVDSTGRAR